MTAMRASLSNPVNGAMRFDLAGRVFGRWTVLRPVPSVPGKITTWRAQCVCGTRRIVRTTALLSGQSRSCGCARVEMLKARGLTCRLKLAGRVFGELTVLGRAKNVPCRAVDYPNGRTAWVCRCRCGRMVIVKTIGLVRKQSATTHCGCRYLLPAVQLKAEPGYKIGTAAEVLRAIAEAASPALAPPAPPPSSNGNGHHPDPALKVRAMRQGFYRHVLRRAGDVFVLTRAEDFTFSWMARVDQLTPTSAAPAPIDPRVRWAAKPWLAEDDHEPAVLFDPDPWTWT